MFPASESVCTANTLGVLAWKNTVNRARKGERIVQVMPRVCVRARARSANVVVDITGYTPEEGD